MSNIIFLMKLPGDRLHNIPHQWTLPAWHQYAKRHDLKIFVLDKWIADPKIVGGAWHKMFIYNILEKNNIDYDQVMYVDLDILPHPDAPNIFEYTECGTFYAVHNDGSYDWVLRSMEVYSQMLFDGYMFPFTEYFNAGLMIFDQSHKEFWNNVIDFFKANVNKILEIQRQYKLGTDQTVVNFLVQKNKIKYKFLPYKWNMQDMVRKEILDAQMTCTKFGYFYHFNAIPANYHFRFNPIIPPRLQWAKFMYSQLYK